MMGMKDRMVEKAAAQMSEQSAAMFKDLIRIQESMHGYLEKLLEVQRMAYDEVKTLRKEKSLDLEATKWKDKFQ